jgi:uncharacterized protein (TIGR00297 family)
MKRLYSLDAEQFIVITLIGIAAAVSSYFNLLSSSGAVAASLTGILVWAGFGINGLIVMGIFFVTSSLLSKYKHKRKEHLGELHEKGSARDWAQVAANGGTAALAGLANLLSPDPVWLLVFSISLASANADTWASELGVLSKKWPVSVKNMKRVPRGTSGAVSGFGTAASAAGSLLIALSAYFRFGLEQRWAVAIFIFGFVGTMLDTLLGAYLQAGYKCVKCGLFTEKTLHCSMPTIQVSGYKKLNNDAVNFISCFTAAFLGMVLYIVF